MNKKSCAEPPADIETAVYQIRIKGVLSDRRQDWFEGMKIESNHERGETIITGKVIDQAALHGLINRIRDLGLPLLALVLVEVESN
ncbi:MAG: hypothetical protein R3293_00405 [Candidatus Promineifilaceae bacterium]|nr:hypothetical protein [Candidatus Promineifilaceae bacterium]